MYLDPTSSLSALVAAKRSSSRLTSDWSIRLSSARPPPYDGELPAIFGSGEIDLFTISRIFVGTVGLLVPGSPFRCCSSNFWKRKHDILERLRVLTENNSRTCVTSWRDGENRTGNLYKPWWPNLNRVPMNLRKENFYSLDNSSYHNLIADFFAKETGFDRSCSDPCHTVPPRSLSNSAVFVTYWAPLIILTSKLLLQKKYALN